MVFVIFIVGREVLESVLFLSALNLEYDGKASLAIGAGTLVSLLISLVAGVLIIRFTKKLPIPIILRISSIVLAFLSVVLLGKAIHSFQETGLIPISATPWNFRVEILGVYPTWQSFLCQSIALLTILFIAILPDAFKTIGQSLKLLPTDNSPFVKRS